MEIIKKFEEYNRVKIELLKMSKCIDSCDESQKDLYQNICVEYSKELNKMKKFFEETYEIKICNCYGLEKEISSSTEKD